MSGPKDVANAKLSAARRQNAALQGHDDARREIKDLLDHRAAGQEPAKLRRRGNDNIYGCEASYAEAKQWSLDAHYRKHTGERPYKCTWAGCSYATAQQQHLDTHYRTHTGEKPHKCPWAGCSYAAARKFCLTNHIARRHGTNS